ncbi:Bax inhibitor-1/YccA family protein [Porticoccus litoralis]|jgi:modulator of FtsH protease|uniref:Bax inhibitor-1/YccA family protein n=1 Tax=Porticoccus litoralis TaxID=434086 RepID=A0AAW8B667_9GAMM|nr:Bax inhibitor-1/YccA family protein [Porticoccus litoralis]MDP1521154.1 Bax inhibitor-1/YccA family protein [Porticoccus litoralis]TNE90540.1 MAG: Bax inhibitor-1/YccA family protein [Gammaproteobacteria bacterium]
MSIEKAVVSTTLDPAATKVLRNTYALLAMTLAFSAVMSGVAMAINAPFMGLWMLLPYFVCLWMVEKNKNSTAGLFWVFALTGWMGFTLGPILSFYLATSGAEPIMTALGGTALIFAGCSAYVLITRKELSFMTGFLMTGVLVAFVAAIANVFLQIQGLALAVSCMFLFLSAGIIMWQTSAIIHGGERNYISATVTLFVMIYNLFTSLLSLIGLSND